MVALSVAGLLALAVFNTVLGLYLILKSTSCLESVILVFAIALVVAIDMLAVVLLWPLL